MKRHLFVLFVLTVTGSLVLTACGGAAPTEQPAPVTVQPGPVAILVLDDFVDEVSDPFNIQLQTTRQ